MKPYNAFDNFVFSPQSEDALALNIYFKKKKNQTLPFIKHVLNLWHWRNSQTLKYLGHLTSSDKKPFFLISPKVLALILTGCWSSNIHSHSAKINPEI